jgi:hypothetical protein
MKYWEEMFGSQPLTFIEGVIEGVKAYAIWKNGTRVVGCMEEPLNDVIEEIRRELGYYEQKADPDICNHDLVYHLKDGDVCEICGAYL